MGSQESSRDESQAAVTKSDLKYGGTINFYKLSQTAVQTIYLEDSAKQNFIELLQSRRKLSHHGLITVRSHKLKQIRQSCGMQTCFEVEIDYQYATRTLEDQISKYCVQKLPFPEQQLRRIFGTVVQMLLYLKNQGTLHGDIKPTTIMVDKYGNVKLIDSYFVNGGKINFQIVMENPSSMSLLSPDQLQTLKSKRYANIDFIHQSEMWQIGLSMLQAMTAEPAMQCYDLTTLNIKTGYFNLKLREMMSYGYSQVLSQLVLACLSLNLNQRPTFEQFLQTVRTNRHPINQSASNNPISVIPFSSHARLAR